MTFFRRYRVPAALRRLNRRDLNRRRVIAARRIRQMIERAQIDRFRNRVELGRERYSVMPWTMNIPDDRYDTRYIDWSLRIPDSYYP